MKSICSQICTMTPVEQIGESHISDLVPYMHFGFVPERQPVLLFIYLQMR